MMKNKVFVLGDSRTGTMTIHKFLKFVGYTSIHYFFKESGVSEPAHVDFARNWTKLSNFIDNSGYDAFSDYPVRLFYKQLFMRYPDAVFILSVRKDLATWQRSMKGFFSKFNIDLEIENLSESYLQINDEIRSIAKKNGARFCEICIDFDSEDNGKIISDTLGLETPYSLGWENQTDSYDNALWSSRVTLYNTQAKDYLNYVKRITHPSKAMLSEYGWTYLINDSSDFMDYFYGEKDWPKENTTKAVQTLASRTEAVGKLNAKYLKFVVPEKCVIYPEYLPKIFEGRKPSETRPAVQIANSDLDIFHYLEPLLKDVRSYGNLYFRGDSHTNWLGAYFVYFYIAEHVNNELRSNKALAKRAPLRLGELQPSLAAYGGDLFAQLEDEFRSVFDGAWKALNLGDKMENLVRYVISEGQRESERVEVEQDYLKLLGERETFRFVNPNKALPRAVVFRDSTSDFVVDLLAEHFSESLFIWHKGLVYEDVIKRERPDIVIHVMAERFVVQYKNNPVLTDLGI